MKNEAEFKAAFKKSVRAQGGFAISLSAPMISGIPDLYVIMPGYCPILLEAKWLGKVKYSFSQTIKYTKLQNFYLNEICQVKDYTAMGLIGWEIIDAIKNEPKYWCTLVHPLLKKIDWGNTNLRYMPYVDKLFHISALMSYYPIPHINGIHATTST